MSGRACKTIICSSNVAHMAPGARMELCLRELFCNPIIAMASSVCDQSDRVIEILEQPNMRRQDQRELRDIVMELPDVDFDRIDE